MQASTIFDEMRSLKYDWDGCGSIPPIPAIVNAVESFISKLPGDWVSDLDFAPRDNGAIRLGWRNGWKFLELEFESPDRICYIRWYAKQGIDDEGSFYAHDIERALNLIGWVVSQERD